MRRGQRAARLMALRMARPYEGRLKRLRKDALRRLFKDLENVKIDDWAWAVDEYLREDYLNDLMRRLYLTVGNNQAKVATERFITKKQDWEDVLNGWLNNKLGSKVTSISGTFKEWVMSEITEGLNKYQGVEKIVQSISKDVLSKYGEIADWQVRRIVQTETLTAMNVSSEESVKSLKVPYTKTWVIAGNNTRQAHLEMDGVTIGEDELFVVGGELMAHPMDDSNGATAGNIINCSCGIIHNPVTAF